MCWTPPVLKRSFDRSWMCHRHFDIFCTPSQEVTDTFTNSYLRSERSNWNMPIKDFILLHTCFIASFSRESWNSCQSKVGLQKGETTMELLQDSQRFLQCSWGVGIIIGTETNTILHVGVRNKYCFQCSIAELRTQKNIIVSDRGVLGASPWNRAYQIQWFLRNVIAENATFWNWLLLVIWFGYCFVIDRTHFLSGST